MYVVKDSASKVKKILVVDDDTSVTRLFELSLKTFGYRVHVDNSSSKALDYFVHHSESVDCVITDLQMPEMDGIALAQEIRRANVKIPIIMCTGCDDQTLDSIDKSNIDVVLHKPIDLSDLNTAIHGYTI